jgi:uncharacterized RDD family membrane protein YckC
MKTGTLLIRTPEGIVFSQTLAGPVTRFLAWLMDFLTITAALSMVQTFLNTIGYLNANIAGTIFILLYFIVSIGYGIAFEWMWRGQTIGKRLFRLRVVDAEGMRLQFDQVMTRNLLRFADMLPGFYFVGGVACLLSRKYQRLGDIAANTVVVRTPVVQEPDLEQLLGRTFNSLRQYPYLAARLRQRVSPAEAATALQAIVRRAEFEPSARLELFEQLASHFRSKVEFPPDATDGVSDEQYIRNVADILTVTRREMTTPHH